MRIPFEILFVILLIQTDLVFGFFTNDDGIKTLTDSDFNSTVIESSDVWVVIFYAEWCPRSKGMAPEIKKLGQMKKTFQLGAVDTENPELLKRYRVKGYPTVFIFGKNKNEPKEYNGAENAADIQKTVDSGKY